MDKIISIDDNYTREQISKCVDELCKNGIAKGCFDMEVLVYLLGFISLFENFHKKGGDV